MGRGAIISCCKFFFSRSRTCNHAPHMIHGSVTRPGVEATVRPADFRSFVYVSVYSFACVCTAWCACSLYARMYAARPPCPYVCPHDLCPHACMLLTLSPHVPGDGSTRRWEHRRRGAQHSTDRCTSAVLPVCIINAALTTA